MHWATFEFNYRLDVQRLMPHIAAMEPYNEAAFTRVLPLWWREQSGELNPIGTEDNPLSQPELSRPLGLLSRDRKSTRLNSSHGYISYAVFCLKKKKPK